MNTLSKALTRLATCFTLLALVGQASEAQAGPMTTFQGRADGVFTNPSGPSEMVTTGIGTDFFTWGVAQPEVSSFRFTGHDFTVTTPTGYILGSRAQSNRPVFSLGTLDYHNGTTRIGTTAETVRLDATVRLTSPVAAGPAVIPAGLAIDTTRNTADPIASADTVFLPGSGSPVTLTTAGGAPITVEPVGFGNISGDGFTQLGRFSVLEGASASADLLARMVSPCESIVYVVPQVLGGDACESMGAQFIPKFGLTTKEAAELCGYDHFNWISTITRKPIKDGLPYNYYTHAGYAPNTPMKAPPAYIDPVPGGYTYQTKGADLDIFYWDEDDIHENPRKLHEFPEYLEFFDRPSNPALPNGEFMEFVTSLVGIFVRPDGSRDWDNLYTWHWTSTCNGTVGDVSVTANTLPVDPGSGTGGATILNTDLSAEDIPQEVRELMQSAGARNVDVSGPTAAVALSGAPLRTGQTITYQATLTPGSAPTQADIYLWARLPDGVTFVSLVQASPGGAISIALGPSPVPFRVGATLSSMTVPFSYTFSGSEPAGTYLAYAGLVTAGADPLQPANRLSLAVEPFQFTP